MSDSRSVGQQIDRRLDGTPAVVAVTAMAVYDSGGVVGWLVVVVGADGGIGRGERALWSLADSAVSTRLARR